jgi:DNA polymerase III subunit alpha
MDKMKFDCGCEFPILEDKVKDYDGLPALDIDFDNLNYNCPLTWDVFTKSTMGIFQLQTPLGETWSKKLKPTSVEEVAALGALLRPGCLKAIVDGKSVTSHFVDRKNKEEPVVYEHPSLEDILNTTYGVLTYQEQTLKIVQKLAGFDLKQTDILRRAIGKKDPKVMSEVEEKFIEGVKKVGIVTPEEGRAIWANIRKSERYSFNKSHSVAYAIIGFWTATLKAHFPLHFYTAWLSFAKYKLKGKEEIRNLVRDAKWAGYEIFNPSLRQLSSDFKLTKDGIYFGISNIKGVGESQYTKLKLAIDEAEKIVNKKIKDFSWQDILIYVLPEWSKTVVNNLILVGAISYIGYDRKKMLYQYNIIKSLTDKELANLRQLQGSIVDRLKVLKVNKKRQLVINDLIQNWENPTSCLEDNAIWLNKTEEDLLGIPLTVSKLTAAGQEESDTTCRQFKEGKTGDCNIAAEILTSKEITTKKSEKMGFLSVEDESDFLDNIAVFPDVWNDYKNILYAGNTVLLNGYKSSKGSLVLKTVKQL